MSTATPAPPLAQPVVDAEVIHAARGATGMSPRHQSILWEAYIERELHVLDEAAMASRTPEHLDSLRWVVPLLSPEERERLLARPRHDMMPEAFDRLLDYCVSLLDAADGARLRSAFCSGRLERGGWPQ